MNRDDRSPNQRPSTHDAGVKHLARARHGRLPAEGEASAIYEQVVKSLMLLCAANPGFPPLGEPNFLAYYKFLQDLPSDVLAEAFVRVGSNWRWSNICPGAGVIRAKALEVLAEQQGLDTPASAWGLFLRTVQRLGVQGVPIYESDESSVVLQHETPHFTNPVLQATVEALGGYHHLARQDLGAPDRKHFMDIYERLLATYQEERTVDGLLPIARQLAGQVPLPALSEPE